MAEHEAHDLALVVAFADGEVDADERQAAEQQVATCAACATLVADIRAIGTADRSLATPPRPRDYRLTPADAARLSASEAEPVATGARLVGDMTRADPAHPTHDPELIAAAADGQLAGADLDRARTWLAACAACADLHDDLVAIAAANRTMPTPVRARDYTLTAEDAARLRSGGWRGFLARIGTPRDAFSRPLALGFTTLGLAGLLLTSVPSLSLSGAASAPAPADAVVEQTSKTGTPDDTRNVFSGQAEQPGLASAAASAAPAAPDVVGEAAEGGADGPGRSSAGGALPSAAPVPAEASETDTSQTDASQPETMRMSATEDALAGSTGPSTVTILSGLILLGGLGLFGLRWSARRLRSH